jgi:molybdate transport system regulatory protein
MSTAARHDAAYSIRIRPSQRIWLQDGGTPVFGVGIRELLIRVEATGSLHQAAADMGIAYSKAWRIVRRAEDHLGFALMSRRAGGVRGGGSTPSEEARWLVSAFGALMDEAGVALDNLYAKHFGTADQGIPRETGEPARPGAPPTNITDRGSST